MTNSFSKTDQLKQQKLGYVSNYLSTSHHFTASYDAYFLSPRT